MSLFAGKTLMITGGTGSFGNAVLGKDGACHHEKSIKGLLENLLTRNSG